MTAISNSALEHVIGAEGLFVLHLRDGSVRLHGSDGDVVRVADDGGEDLAAAFAIERGEGHLSLRTEKGLRIRLGRGRRGDSPDLRVEVPRRATIVVEGRRTDVTGEDLVGEQRYQTVSGDIKLTRVAGQVSIEAVSGDVGLTAVGDLRLHTKTVSGDLAARAGRIEELVIATTSGDIAVAGELAAEARHRIETVSGDTLLALAGGVRVELTTVTGDVSADVPHRAEGGRGRRVLVIGDGRATLSAHSMSGDVRVVEPRPFETSNRVPEPPAAPPAPTAPTVPTPPGAPAGPEPAPPPTASDAAIAAAYDEARLRILRSLERGEIDVAEAGRRLEALDAAGVPGSESDV